ncbi:MAG: hypothetical protein QG646_866, partial [Euryarchaeota archaeon]|nr:hypothetical protein [Euryarchaeota archaeon]
MSFIGDSDAYIPYSVIGIFIVLAATFTSVYLLKMDSEVAETIYTTEKIDPRQTAINVAASDLARCLNYAGMGALEWQGENPVIIPENSPVERVSDDGFMAIPKNQNLENGDTLQVSINLPSDIWGKIESIWKNKDIKLIVKDSKGQEIKNQNYGQATSFFQQVSFDEDIIIPDTAAPGYSSIELFYGDELKASDWFIIGVSPIKEITADSFNKLLSVNYQGNTHTFMEYAINVEPDIKPEQIKIKKVQGTLQREINPTDKNYTIYYVFEIPVLNYTIVDLESGEKFNRSIKVSTLITSREPLLEDLVREYEAALGNSSGLDSTSNLVLGATNLRTFIYGPWQRYAHGPLNILTNPALSSSVNGATLYTQKKVFDSVDPLALTYTSYYNGKVLYGDIFDSGSKKTDSGSASSDPGSSGNASNAGNESSGNSYEKDKSVNLTTTYNFLAENKSFSLNVEKGIGESLEETNTSIKELSDSSKITVSASDYTDGVLDGWVFNDHAWTKENPDLIHDVTNSVYTASVQGQVLRDDPDIFPKSLDSRITPNFGSSSVSFGGHDVNWNSNYFPSGTHTGSLVPSYSWSDSITNSYSASLDPSINPPRGDVASWSVKGASVSLLSTEISDVKIEPHLTHTSNDSLPVENRTDGYLNREDHVFDWRIEYDISYIIETRWKIDYDYDYTYQWRTRERKADGNYTTVTHQGTSSGSNSETISETDSESLSPTETESENLTIIYHKRPPAGGYTGLSTYTDPIEREYKQTNFSLGGTERFDPCCSDAADKYREDYVNVGTIASNFLFYPDKMNLPQHSVNCDVPPWLHKVMAEYVLEMLDSIKKDNPAFNYSLVDSPGKNPTDLQVEAARKLVLELETNRET